MKERPILFSAPMVRAILDGSKTQTRRMVKLPHNNPLGVWEPFWFGGVGGGRDRKGQEIPGRWTLGHSRTGEIIGCPIAEPGDQLWVRENGWERPERTPQMMRQGADTWHPYAYDADAPFGIGPANEAYKEEGWKRRPSIHMPRWASRIMLEVTGVRVERLQEISEADALAEGAPSYQEGFDPPPDDPSFDWSYRAAYARLWESINGPGSWDLNPWVWVVEFQKVTP